MDHESLRAVKPNGSAQEVRLHSEGYLGEGVEGVVQSAVASWGDGEALFSHRFAHKELDHPEDAEKLQQIYQHCKEAGLPVPPTFRVTYQQGKPVGLLMTDLTQGGKKVVITPESFKKDRNQLRSEGHETFRKAFMHLDLGKKGKIARDLQSYAHLAAEHGIMFSQHDPWFITLSESGDAQVILGDFGTIGVGQSKGDGTFSDFSLRGPYFTRLFFPKILTEQQIEAKNQRENREFLTHIRNNRMVMRLTSIPLLSRLARR